jgi:hypothetical protein
VSGGRHGRGECGRSSNGERRKEKGERRKANGESGKAHKLNSDTNRGDIFENGEQSETKIGSRKDQKRRTEKSNDGKREFRVPFVGKGADESDK